MSRIKSGATEWNKLGLIVAADKEKGAAAPFIKIATELTNTFQWFFE